MIDQTVAPQSGEEDEQQQIARLQCNVDGLGVGAAQPADRRIRAVDKPREGARDEADVKKSNWWGRSSSPRRNRADRAGESVSALTRRWRWQRRW